jgi:DNA-sulfur modification-associated
MTNVVASSDLELPLDIRNVGQVDDAGGEHIECQMTGRYLVHLHQSGLLKLTGNIRPAHNQERLTGKTKTKVNKWMGELLDNDAIIGNISMRLDPTKSEYEIWEDEDNGQTILTIESGVLDCAVDSLSRIKAILGAADNPLGSFDLDTRFQVRIWLLDDTAAKKVATIYNTRGDKVNDSAAKYAYSETKEQEVARRLVNDSPHLGQDNIEVLANSVSASSHKLTAFNTISKAIETSWKGGPVTAADVEAQSSWLISAWDSLVKVRPEFGMMSTPARQSQRKTTICSTAVVIFGLIGAMSAMYTDHVDPDAAFEALAIAQDGNDPFDLGNPVWGKAGVVVQTDSNSLTTRNSFPARRAATRVLRELMDLGTDPNV